MFELTRQPLIDAFKKLNVSYRRFSDQSGIPHSVIYDILNSNKDSGIERVLALSNALKVNPRKLFVPHKDA